MTMAQFSRDDILIYQGREEGREERFGLDEESASQYYKTYAE